MEKFLEARKTGEQCSEPLFVDDYIWDDTTPIYSSNIIPEDYNNPKDY